MKKKSEKDLLSSVDSSRRDFVAKVAKTSLFAVPLALGAETLTIRKVYAQEASQSGSGGGTGSTSGGVGGGGGAESGAASVPEPSAVALFGLGLASMALHARHRKTKLSKQVDES